MQVHAFKVCPSVTSQPLEEVLEQIEQTGLVDRMRQGMYGQIRVDTIVKRNGFWFMDFVKFRNNSGPGRTHPERPVEGFHFEDGECFGEETAALYNPDNNYILIQYNHHGVRHGSVAKYFQMANNHHVNLYELAPKFDDDIQRKYDSKTIFRRVEFSVASRCLNEGDRQNGLALNKALDIGATHGADKIKITMSAERQNRTGLSFEAVKNTVQQISNLIGLGAEAVDKLEVSGRDSEDAPIEVLDFIGQRLCLYYDVPSGPDLRLPMETRFNFLIDAHRQWGAILG